MHRRVILCALPLGLAFAQDCSGCRSRDADDDRKVLARIETRKAMPIEVVAQKLGRHNGPCTATGGGRGGFSIMPFDQFTYTVQIDPMHYDGYKHGPIALSGGGDSVLFRTDSASERKDDPLADLRLQQCSDAKSRRVALRLRSSAAGTAPPGDDKWTVVYPFTKTIVLPKQKVEGSSCDDALSQRHTRRDRSDDSDEGQQDEVVLMARRAGRRIEQSTRDGGKENIRCVSDQGHQSDRRAGQARGHGRFLQ